MSIHIKYALAGLLLLAACKKETLLYDEPGRLNFRKEYLDPKQDSTTYSFAIKPASLQQDTVWLKLGLMGRLTDTDREIKLEVIPDSTTAVANVHYQLFKYVLPANSHQIDLPVLIKRDPSLKNQQVRLYLKIGASSDLLPGVDTMQAYKVRINDRITKPDNWDRELIYFFGTYSNNKYLFIIQTLGVSEFVNPFSEMSKYDYYKGQIKNALEDYKQQHGHPYLDENGFEVTLD